MPTTERELAEDAQWKLIQKNTFTRWANEHLNTVNKHIADLESDLSDGLRLLSLVEVLSGTKFSKFNKRPNFRTQKLENVTMTLKYLEDKEGIKMVSIDSADIVDCKLKLILGLIWTLILHYSISMPMWGDDDDVPGKKEQTPKQRLLAWVQNKIPDRPIRNFTTDWNDGKVIGALVDAIAPGLCPDWEEWEPKRAQKNAKEAMDAAEQWLDLPQLIKPKEMCNPKVDELSMMTYLSQFPSAKLKPGAPLRPRTNPARVRAYGPGIEPNGNSVGAPARFTVETFKGGRGEVEITILNPKGVKEKCEVVFNNDRNLTYSCVYTPTMEGQYRVIIKFAAREILKSPFTVVVEGAAGDPTKVSAKGPGLEKTGNMVGKQTFFEVFTKGAGLGQVDVGILDPHGQKDVIKPTVVKRTEETWYVEYTPKEEGQHSINVFFAGKAIPHSPFAVGVSPAKGPAFDPKKMAAPEKITPGHGERDTTNNSNTSRSKKRNTGTHQVRENSKTTVLEPEMQQLYRDVCRRGTRKVYQTRLMIIGHFAAGKTSLKKSLLDETPIKEHITTDGLDKLEETVVIDVETAVNWSKVNLSNKDEFATEAAKQLYTRINSKIGETEMRQVPDEVNLSHKDEFATEAAKQLYTRKDSKTGEMERRQVPDEDSGHEHKSAEARAFPEFQEENAGSKTRAQAKEFQEEPVKFDAVKDDVLAKLEKLEKEGHQVQLTIWDFGGQHVYYTSHQTFLTYRAIYLLVMDITKALGDVIEEYRRPLEHIGLPRTAMDFLDFWLNSVHTHLIERELSSDQCDPPVIIVLTKTDILDKDARRRAYMIQEFIEDIDQHLRGKPYYHHVRDIIPVSNLNTNDQGINSLRSKILEEAEQQSYWGEERPTKWLLLADELKNQVSHKMEPVVNLRQVHQAARECGVPEEEVQMFLKFHHNLGDIIYFDEDETKDTVILSPQWLAAQFSKVITQERILKERNISANEMDYLRRGILSNNTAAKLCGTTQPKALVKIMEKFDMLVPCNIQLQRGKEDQAHLVPCLLPRATYQTEQEGVFPKVHFKFLSKTIEHLAYLDARGFVPHGLYHRLVSQCCRVREWSYHEAMIFYDYMTIDVKGFYISLYMVNNGITLSAFKFEGKPVDYCEKLSAVRQRIQSMIEEITIDVFPNLRGVLCLECNCSVVHEPCRSQSFAARHVMKTRGHIPVQESEGVLDSRVFCDHHRMIIDTAPWDTWFSRSSSTEGPDLFPCGGQEIATEGKKLQAELMSHPQILNAIPDCIHDQLVGAAFLSFDDVDQIKKKDTMAMFQMLVSRVKTPQDRQAVKDAVCRGLCESSQYCPFSGKEELATEDQLLVLRRHYPSLIEDMDVTPALDRLFQIGIADAHTRDLVRAEKTRRGRVYQLLKFIEHVHKRAQDQFMDILKETNWWIFGDDPPAEK